MIEAAIGRDDPDELRIAVLSAALHAQDPVWAEGVCVRLVSHPHWNVRGNAVLGFGHLARIHGALDRARVLPLVEAALADGHRYVRGQAYGAADDLEQYLGWAISRPPVT